MAQQKFNTDLAVLLRETKAFFHRSSGPGGQRKNKRETAVKLHHIPSGLWVVANEARSQVLNKKIAFRRHQERLSRLNKHKKRRIPTHMPAVLKEEILRRKKIRSEKKRLRKKVDLTEDY